MSTNKREASEDGYEFWCSVDGEANQRAEERGAQYTYGTRVTTPYGEGSVVEINDAYGVKVQYDSGGSGWHQFPYVRPLGGATE
jgi:hypothetical protein